MRKIKFRGKRKDTGEWVYGYFVGNNLIYNPNVKEGAVCWFEVLPETVGQFTGLHDKNGVEIYEGDIVREDNRRNNPEHEYEVKYDGLNCILSRDDGFNIEEIDDPEVIGNIHEERSKK